MRHRYGCCYSDAAPIRLGFPGPIGTPCLTGTESGYESFTTESMGSRPQLQVASGPGCQAVRGTVRVAVTVSRAAASDSNHPPEIKYKKPYSWYKMH
eukprot:2488670-Rhodomonas_salina.1